MNININFKEYIKQTSLRVEPLSLIEQIEFEQYLEELYGEAYGDLLKKGWETAKGAGQEFGKQFGQAYQQAKVPKEDPAMENKIVAMAKKAYPTAQHWADKLGIPISLVLAVIVSGALGGPAAVPLTIATYYIRKPLLKLAGKGFDVATEKMGLGPQQPGQPQPTGAQPVTAQVVPEPTRPQPVTATAVQEPELGFAPEPWRGPGKSRIQHGRAGRQHYYAGEAYQYDEAWGDWMKKAAGWTGKKLGGVAGAGRRNVGNLANIMTSNAKAMWDFARKNKMKVAKGLFLIGVGALIGMGVNAIVNAGDAASAVAQSAEQTGVPQADIDELAGAVGMEAGKVGAGMGADEFLQGAEGPESYLQGAEGPESFLQGGEETDWAQAAQEGQPSATQIMRQSPEWQQAHQDAYNRAMRIWKDPGRATMYATSKADNAIRQAQLMKNVPWTQTDPGSFERAASGTFKHGKLQ